MKIKKMMLVGIILLAILTMGAVSASEDANFNETLTVNEIQETMDVSSDDNIISGDGGNLSASPDENLLGDDYFEVELEVNESEFSTNPDELNVAFAKVTVPEGSEGKVVFEDEDGNGFFKKNLTEFIEQHKQTQDDRITYSIYLNEGNPFLFDGFKDGDWFKLAVWNIDDEEIYSQDYFIRFSDEAVRFERDWHNPGDHVEINVNTDFSIYDDEGDFAWINLPSYVTAGKVMVTCGGYDLFESVVDDEFNYPWGQEGDGHYFCAFKPASLNHWLDLNNADIITFSFLDENNETIAFKNYKFYISGEDVHLDELPTSQNFNFWISSHECKNNDEAKICEIWIEGVDEGSIILTIEKFDGTVRSYDMAVETGYIQCNLEALDILDEIGKYTVNITYSCDCEIPLAENHEFALTNLEYDTCGDVYVDYPFDVIRFYTERGENIKVYVDGEERQSGGENPLRWKLSNLEIGRAGQYTITIRSYDEENGLIEEFSYALNVFDVSDEVILYSSDLGLRSWETDGPILYLICPDNEIGEHFTLYINDNYFDDFDGEYLMSWTVDDLGVENGEDYDIKLYDNDNHEIASAWISISGGYESYLHIWDEDEDGILYSDMDCNVVEVEFPMGTSGFLYVIVDGEVKYAPLAHYRDYDYMDNSYVWSLATLNMTSPKRYNVTLVFFDGENNETLKSKMVNVVKFDNDTFRARYDSSTRYVEVFCPDGAEGNITIYIYDNSHVRVYNETCAIDSTYYNQWNEFFYVDYDFIEDYNAEIYINDEEIRVEKRGYGEEDNYRESEWISIMSDKVYPGDNIVEILRYYAKDLSDANVTITNGDYRIVKRISDFATYDWRDHYYVYEITFEDLDSFENFNDRDIINFTFESKYGKQTKPYVLQKVNGLIILHRVENVINDGSDLFDILFPEGEEDEVFNTSQENVDFIKVTVPESYNVTKAEIIISSGDKIVFNKTLTEFVYEFDYDFAMNIFTRTYLLEEMDFTCLNDKDIVNFTLIFDGSIMETGQYVYHIIDDELIKFYDFISEIAGEVHWGEVGIPEFGPGNHDGTIIWLDIPDYLNITEGTVQITDDDGNVLYSIELSEMNTTDDGDVREGVIQYVIMADGFPYDTAMPDGVNLTFSFNYNGTQLVFGKGIRIGRGTYRHVMPEQVDKLFKITLPDGVLVNGEDDVIYIYATPAANRQSVPIDLGDGYFVVYVNGKKIEDLGRLIRVDGEKELDVVRLEMDFRDFYLYLPDLNITENGIYDIKIDYEVASFSETTGVGTVELYRSNVTLTSNVKTNYQNGSVELLTGYGLNPNLLYLDTYYGAIDEVTGRITVLNDKGEVILESDIRDLPIDNGRRYLKYLDFTDDFGDNVTIRYSDGNERNGEVTLDVLWRNATSDDFAPVILEDVNDYYGDIINLTIPDTINDGQIIVTVKFKNKYGADVPGMDVTADFDSKAIFTFNVADIKASYDGAFGLSLSKLGIDDKNGNYTIGIDFTADGGLNTLNIKNQSMEVELSNETVILIDEFSRYGLSLPFASVKVFKPISAHTVLMIDDEIYATQNFKNGLIEFYSSKEWTAGSHKAEIIVLRDDGTQITNLTQNFETLIKSDDVAVSMESEVRENRNVIVMITVPKSGTATIRINGSSENSFLLREGENTVDLGILPNGEYSVWIAYEATLDDGNLSFYNNFLPLTVGNSWLYVPDPVVVNDDDVIRVSLEKSASGYVVVKINNEVYANVSLINGSCEIKVTGFDYGEYDYNVTYSGDGTHDSLSQAGKFKITYRFKDNLDETEYPLSEYYDFIVYLPDDATGTVTITIDGKTYTAEVKDGKAIFKLENLSMGQYPIDIYYSGDGNYPAMNYTKILNIAYYAPTGVIGERGVVLAVNLLLPSNANGNLVVYLDKTGTWYKIKEVIGGKASVDLTDLPIGIYNIRAVYDGNDIEVRPYTATFTVLPKINITQELIVGEDINITMDLDNASGYVIIYIGNEYIAREIVDGKISYAYSTKDIPYGNYSVSFQYIGNSFDRNVFNYWDPAKEQVVPVEFIVNVLPQKFSLPQEFEVGPDGVMHMYVPGEAEGIFDVYMEGVLAARLDLRHKTIESIISDIEWKIRYTEDGRIEITASFKNRKGNIPLTFDYYGDGTFESFRQNSIAKIPGKVQRISAGSLSMVYTSGKTYSVTVYGPAGNAVNGVQVKFLINNKAIGSAITNAKGVAKIVISKTPGTYKITATSLGVSASAKLTVKHVITLKTVKVKKSAKKLVLTATLKKVNGKSVKGKRIIFKFNGKTYKVKTNKKGIAKVTINKKVLKKLKVGKKVRYQVTYLKDTVKKTAKVKK